MQHTTPLECRNQFNGAPDVLVMVVTTEGYGDLTEASER